MKTSPSNISSASWIPQEWWDSLNPDERQRFLPFSPLFVIELRSSTDTLKTLRAKMQEYIDNGTELGWLIDPFEHCVEVYRPDAEVVVLQDIGRQCRASVARIRAGVGQYFLNDVLSDPLDRSFF